jgi:hypothetical protein
MKKNVGYAQKSDKKKYYKKNVKYEIYLIQMGQKKTIYFLFHIRMNDPEKNKRQQ